MKESSRRQILHGMAGVSLLPALNFLNAPTAPEFRRVPREVATTAQSQTLAVVFHGLFAFLFGLQGDPIEIVVPVVGGHKYWAGNFGQEDENELQRGGSFCLTGVNPGKWPKNFDFPFLTNLSSPDSSNMHCKITIPWPDCLMFDRQVYPITGENFFTSPPNLNPAQLPAIYGFLYYDTTIASRPELTGTLWKGPRTMGQPQETVSANLHIRAEHCGNGTASGSAKVSGWTTFNELFGLTGANQLALNSKYGKVGPCKGIGTTVPASETKFLAEEYECNSHGKGDPNLDQQENSATNCASIGGCKPGVSCS